MTTLHDRLPDHLASRSAAPVVAVAFAIVGLVAIGLWTAPTFTGGGADMAHHYALVYWFSHNGTLPPGDDAALAEMARYPPGAHVVAALVGHAVGSPFRGMQLVATGAVASIWLAIAALLTILPGRRGWVALTALLVFLALDTPAGPLRLHVHGFEVVGNFFFAQIAGQTVVWWLVWFAVRSRLAGRAPISTALPIAIAAVLATFVHVLPAVELLVIVGCLSIAELHGRWRAGRRTVRSFALPILLPATTAVAIVLTPGFRAMRTLSENNGSLDVPYLSGLAGYVGVAIAVAVISLLLLGASALRRDEAATAAVLQGLAFAGIAVAVPCLVQTISLAGGEGSQYAVKKYVFGLLTILVADACVAVATLVPRGAIHDGRPRRTSRLAATVILTVIAAVTVFSHPGARYSMSEVTALERNVVETAAAEHLEVDGRDYAVALPDSDPVLDYMFSTAVLRAPKQQAVRALLQGDWRLLRLASGQLTTAAGSPYDSSACRRLGPHDGLVAVDARCWRRTTTRCDAVNILGRHGLVLDPRLHGFSGPEESGRWTDGRHASFSCVLAGRRDERPIAIAVDATAFLPAHIARQRVRIAVGHVHRQFVFTPRAPHAVLRLVVPRLASARLTVRLTLPDAVSPRSVGFNADPRVLALFVDEIRIG